jgi:ComF family protein
MIRDLANALLATLVAPVCAACNRLLDRPLDGPICDPCWAAIAPRVATFSLHGIDHAQALGIYDGTLRDVLHALKYEGRRSIAPRLSQMMAAHGAGVLLGADYVVPVPLHRRRLRERGFNQADDLACGLGVPVLRALRRVKATKAQVDLPASARRENVRSAFALPSFTFGRTKSAVRQKVIVLVDDVATTGATLDACARVLRRAGAAEVRALTAARVVT